MAKVQFIQP